MTAKTYRMGIDIGGTFTDFVLTDTRTGEIQLYKHLTTPADPSLGALKGLSELLERAGLTHADLAEIVHGTTLVTNAVIERKGAPVGMITTKGFRDILEIGTEQRYDIYDLTLAFPEPLVARAWRREVAGRITADGSELTPLDEAAVLSEAAELVAAGAKAIAVAFMHAYRNPAHEQRAAELVRAAHPEISVSISSDVVAEISEYQRFVTTCANAYVQPLMNRYLQRFESELAAHGFDGDFRLMSSAGGLVSSRTARDLPIRLLESGPAGGALATAWFGLAVGKENVISFDMGGTTAKACMIENGRAHIASFLEAGRTHRFKNGSGLPIKSPVVDMIEIGAGGGSIASIDAVGLMQVGPHSAGAAPGPACYGQGGDKPTVTDASVALGYYNPDNFLGGRMTLDKAAAETAIGTLAGPLGIGTMDAAWGIHQTVAESMASAAQIHLVEKGKDPRAYSMIGFGGAGPAFAAKVARILGVSEVIIPPASGAASAFGFLTAPLSVDMVRSRPMDLSEALASGELSQVLADMAFDAKAELAASGVAESDMVAEPAADMRIRGQLHDITVPLPQGPLGTDALEAIRAAFANAYSERYTRVPTDAQIEILSLRLRLRGPEPKITITMASDGVNAAAGAALKGTRQTWFGNEFLEASVYDRRALTPADEVAGPAIVEEPESTTIIPPGDVATQDAAGNLIIKVAASARAATRITTKTPRDEAIKLLESDPITLEIMWSRLVTVSEEMWHTVCRTAFSLIISESQDFGCAILDPKGETIAHSARVMPVFNLTLPWAVRHILKTYPVESMKPGDVYITNDPWECAGHLFDLAIVTPVFSNGKVVALMGTVGHVGDIGGLRDGLSATQIFEEGMQIPPMKLLREGAENEDLFRLMGENIRDSEQVLGDVRSLITANERGQHRIEAFLSEYGLEDLEAFSEVIQSRSEAAMRAAIRDLPDGVYTSSISNNPMGEVMTFPLELTVKGDTIALDFDGAPPAVTKGGINCTLSYTSAHATYPLKCMLTPNVRGNAGCYRPFNVSAPKGSILNCEKPSPVSLRTRTGWYLAPNVFRAMEDTAPDRVQAFSGLPSLLSFYGRNDEGKMFYELLLLGAGQGGSAKQDGKSPILWPTSAATTSLELMETRIPVLIEEKSLIQDSAGAGANRGGLGVRVRARRLNGDSPMQAMVAPEGVNLPMEGAFGGTPGRTAQGVLRNAQGEVIHNVGTGGMVDLNDTETVVELCLSGGSGFGKPEDRPLDAIERDLSEGYISAEAAETIYGLSKRRTSAA